MISEETKKLTERITTQVIKHFIILFVERNQKENILSENLTLKQYAILSDLSNIMKKNNVDQIEKFINNFVAKNKSSLAAHQKGKECLKIYNSLNNNNNNSHEKPNLDNELVNLEINEVETKVEQSVQEQSQVVTQVSQSKKSKVVKGK